MIYYFFAYPASRDLLYTHSTSCVPTKNVYVSSPQFAFSLKPQIEVLICADVSENRLLETKNNFKAGFHFGEFGRANRYDRML